MFSSAEKHPDVRVSAVDALVGLATPRSSAAISQ